MIKVHVEWGKQALLGKANTAIIVDCLSFSTALNVACENGARVYPFPLSSKAGKFAKLVDAKVVGKRAELGLSLSPPSLAKLDANDQVVLPSPNGSNLSLFANHDLVLCAALRNASAAATLASSTGGDVIIAAAGERWQTDGSLRPAIEDWIAAGAIASCFSVAELTSEAKHAVSAFNVVKGELAETLASSVSGTELAERGFVQDVEWAAQLNVSTCVPKLNRLSSTYEDIGLHASDLPNADILQRQIVSYSKA